MLSGTGRERSSATLAWRPSCWTSWPTTETWTRPRRERRSHLSPLLKLRSVAYTSGITSFEKRLVWKATSLIDILYRKQLVCKATGLRRNWSEKRPFWEATSLRSDWSEKRLVWEATGLESTSNFESFEFTFIFIFSVYFVVVSLLLAAHFDI